MKIKLILLALIFSALPISAATTSDNDLPKPLAFARYEGMTNKSPFAVASAPVNAPPPPNVFKDLYISNCAKVGDEGIVTLSSSVDKNFKEYLSTKSPNKAGYTITNIEWSDHVGATKVTISKDGQAGTLTFNQALISSAISNPPVAMPQPVIQPPVANGVTVNGVPSGTVPPVQQYNPPPGNVTTIKPAPIPTLPTPPPRVRGVIQRNPAASSQGEPVRSDDN